MAGKKRVWHIVTIAGGGKAKIKLPDEYEGLNAELGIIKDDPANPDKNAIETSEKDLLRHAQIIKMGISYGTKPNYKRAKIVCSASFVTTASSSIEGKDFVGSAGTGKINTAYFPGNRKFI